MFRSSDLQSISSLIGAFPMIASITASKKRSAVSCVSLDPPYLRACLMILFRTPLGLISAIFTYPLRHFSYF